MCEHVLKSPMYLYTAVVKVLLEVLLNLVVLQSKFLATCRVNKFSTFNNSSGTASADTAVLFQST